MERTTTIGQERQYNPAFMASEEETFVQKRLTGLLAYPAYDAHMALINRQGPAILERLPDLSTLSTKHVEHCLREGARLVEARSSKHFGRAHLPSAVNNVLDSAFGTYVGWTIPFDSPLILVMPDPLGALDEQAVTQLIRIGFDKLEGYLQAAWQRDRQKDVPSGRTPSQP